MKKLIFSLIFSILFVSANAQSLDNNFLNSSPILKKLSKENSLIFSAKAGYHTEYDKNSINGFNSGMIYSLNIDGSLLSKVNIGISFDFWHHSDDQFKTYEGVLHPVTYTGTNLSFNLTKRVRGKDHSVNFGIGIGVYTLNRKSPPYDSSEDSFFNLKLLLGADIRISKIVFLSPQIEYNNMFNFDRTAGTFSFKIGPSIILED